VDYAYDALDRLTQARPSTSLAGLGLPQEQYGYDAVHNRISSLHQPGEWQYASGNRLTQHGLGADLVRYGYTATGHVQSATRNGSVTTNIYDATERRVAVEQDGQLIARYQYDPFGRRISKTLGAGQGAQTTWFIYSEEGLLAEVDTLGKTVRTYGWQPGTDWGTEPLWQADHASAQNSSSRTYHYLHNDHLSTPQVASDAAGRSSWQALSESFGNTLERSDNRTRMNLRFAGQYYDEEAETHFNYYRDYSPAVGRYLQSDPSSLDGGINGFNYANLNPSSYIDNNGLVAYIPDPNGVVPGGPWVPNDGNRPGNFLGPKPLGGGGRAQCQWVPADGAGGPPGSDGYWKVNEPGTKGWSRFDKGGRPITPEQAHPGNVSKGQKGGGGGSIGGLGGIGGGNKGKPFNPFAIPYN
jgi:RHS repeat-associated protein